MKFSVLGPLRVSSGVELVPLGGSRQRAALGYLLLFGNDVVATSQMMQALWGSEPPPTARKILQNAISGLRRILPPGPGTEDGGPETLVTRPPGYMLQVDPDDLDLLQFRELYRRGRAALADGQWHESEQLLRTALGLWRGPALSDLTEIGYVWPELAALRNARFAALELQMDAALAAGRHQELIGELEPVVEAEPLRERLCQQLMLALYRSGRQADALRVYRRIRSALVGQLGLDPSPDLQRLERAILDHDSALAPVGGAEVRGTGVVVAALEEDPAPVVAAASEEPAVGSSLPPLRQTVRDAEFKRVTAALIRVETPEPDISLEDRGRVLAGVASVVDEHIGRAGGQFHGTFGPLLLAYFGAARTREDDVARAIRMALKLARHRDGDVRLAVGLASGEALVTYRDGIGGRTPPGVTGRFLDTGLRTAVRVPAGTVRVCSATRSACADDFEFTEVESDPDVWEVGPRAFRPELATRTHLPLVQRDRELEQLARLVDDVARLGRPHVVTVLGPAGIGKSRLMHEFRLRNQRESRIRCLVGCNRRIGPHNPYDSLAGVVRSHAAITEDDTTSERWTKLRAAVSGIVAPGPIVTQVTGDLYDLSTPDPDRATGRGLHRRLFAAWRWFVEGLAAEEPTAIILEDLDRTDDELLTFVGGLADCAQHLPLLLVVTARPELSNRTAYWSVGKRSATTMSLEPLSRVGTCTLLDGMLPSSAGAPSTRALDTAVNRSGGNPMFAIEFVRAMQESGPTPDDGRIPLPHQVHNLVAAQLESVSERERSVLYDASLLGPSFPTAMLAGVGEHDADELPEILESLERQGILYRCGVGRALGTVEYAFVHELWKEVISSRVPHSAAAERHHRAARWLDGEADLAVGEMLAHQYRQAVADSEKVRLPTEELCAEACSRLADAGRRAARSGDTPASRFLYRAALEFSTACHPLREQLLIWDRSDRALSSADAEQADAPDRSAAI